MKFVLTIAGKIKAVDDLISTDVISKIWTGSGKPKVRTGAKWRNINETADMAKIFQQRVYRKLDIDNLPKVRQEAVRVNTRAATDMMNNAFQLVGTASSKYGVPINLPAKIYYGGGRALVVPKPIRDKFSNVFPSVRKEAFDDFGRWAKAQNREVVDSMYPWIMAAHIAVPVSMFVGLYQETMTEREQKRELNEQISTMFESRQLKPEPFIESTVGNGSAEQENKLVESEDILPVPRRKPEQQEEDIKVEEIEAVREALQGLSDIDITKETSQYTRGETLRIASEMAQAAATGRQYKGEFVTPQDWKIFLKEHQGRERPVEKEANPVTDLITLLKSFKKEDPPNENMAKGGHVKKKKKSNKKKVQRKITKTYANKSRKPKRA